MDAILLLRVQHDRQYQPSHPRTMPCEQSGERRFSPGARHLQKPVVTVTAAGAAVSWSHAVKLRQARLDGERPEDRSLMLAVSGVALNALLAVLIITSATAPVFLSPCE